MREILTVDAVLGRVLKADPEALLTTRQLVVLYALDTPESAVPVTVRGLSATFNMHKPTISRAIDKLERLGFAQRAPDPRDKRSVLVYTTPLGDLIKAFLDGAEGADAALAAAQKARKAAQKRAADKAAKQAARAAA